MGDRLDTHQPTHQVPPEASRSLTDSVKHGIEERKIMTVIKISTKENDIIQYKWPIIGQYTFIIDHLQCILAR